MALGITFVIYIGSIDLSSQSVASMTTVLLTALLPRLGFVAIPVVILIGAFAGVLSGAISVRAKIPTFITTLAIGGIAYSIAQFVSGEKSLAMVADQREQLLGWMIGYAWGIPRELFFAGGLLIVALFIERRTVIGRVLKAIGAGEPAAVSSGLRVERYKIAAFAISGALAPMIFMGKLFPIDNIYLAIALGVSAAVFVAGLFGLFNGWLIARFNIQPIVATLILFIAGRGIAQVSTNGDQQVFAIPEFQALALGNIFGIPLPFQVWIMAALVGLAAFLLAKTSLGRQILATGGNEKAARLSGIPVARVKMFVYWCSGLCAGLAGIISIAMVSASDANLVGNGKELDAIAAVAVGGTPFAGGRASIMGTVLGAMIIQLVQYALIGNGVPDPVALLAKAGLIVAAVWLQQQEQG
eukprot:gene27652-30623_t